MKTSLSPQDRIECYCPNCNDVLNSQTGFDPSNGEWTCAKCGELLYGDVYNGERFPGIMWHCRECGALLNKQDGFRDTYSEWVCLECGCHEDFSAIIIPHSETSSFKNRIVAVWNKSKPKIIKAVKWGVGIGLTIGTVVAALAVASSTEEPNDTETDEIPDEATKMPPKKSYQGYVPSGCRACGGPYPLCRDGCPAFDD